MGAGHWPLVELAVVFLAAGDRGHGVTFDHLDAGAPGVFTQLLFVGFEKLPAVPGGLADSPVFQQGKHAIGARSRAGGDQEARFGIFYQVGDGFLCV